jgi:hypothetical protein
MAVSSTAAITARILTNFRLTGQMEDNAHNATAECESAFSELRKALRGGFDYPRECSGKDVMLSTVTDEMKNRNGTARVPRTSVH